MQRDSDRKQVSTLKNVSAGPWLGVPVRNLTGFSEAMAKAGCTDPADVEAWVESGIEYDTDLMAELATRWREAGVAAVTAVAWCEVVPSWSPARVKAWMAAGYEPQEAWFTALLIGMAKRFGRHGDLQVSSELQWLSSGLMPSQAALALASGYATVQGARELASALDGDRYARADLEMTAAMDGVHVREFRIELPHGAPRRSGR